MPFTSEEVTASVQKLVAVSLQVRTDATGARRTSDAYQELMSSAAGLFLLYPFAPLYVLYLSDLRLRTQVKAQAVVVDELQRALLAASRSVAPVEDISSLTEARVALSELESASASRSSAFTKTSTLPAYQRFQAQANRFLQGPAQAVKYGGDVVQTPEEARASIPSLVTSLKANQSELQRRTTLLANGYANFEALQLPSKLTQSMLQKARTNLQEHETRLSNQTPKERLSTLRNVTLDMLSTKAAVTTMTAFSPLSAFHPISGIGQPLGDSTHPATPASITVETAGPYPIATDVTSSLEVWADGSSSISETLELNPSLVPDTTGTLLEPFEIDAVTAPFSFSVAISGTTYDFTFDLTALVGSGSHNAEDVADVLNPLVAARNLVFTPIFNTLKLAGITTTITDGGTVGPDWYLTCQAVGSSFIGQGVVVGDTILLEAPVSGGLGALQQTAWTVTTVYPVGVNQDKVIAKRAQTPFVIPTPPNNINFRIGDKKQLNLAPISASTAIATNQVLTITAGAQNTGAMTLGFLPGFVQAVRPVPASELAVDINSKAKLVKASSTFVPYLEQSFYAYSDTIDSTVACLSRLPRVLRTVTAGVSTFTIAVSDVDVVELAVTVGDYVTMRSGSELGDSFVVTAVAPNLITCTGVATSGSVLFDVCPDTDTLVAVNDIVSVTEGPNTLQYPIRLPGDRPTEVILQTALPSFKDPATGQAIEFRAQLGKSHLTLASLNTTLSSALRLTGAASALLDPAYPMATPVYGTTPWLTLPNLPRALETGDTLEQYAADYQLPDTTSLIIDIDRPNKAVKIDGAIDTQTSIPFTDTVPPFARVRVSRHADFQTLSTSLTAWLARGENQSNYFANLDATLNPILVNTNPTLEQVGTAYNKLSELASGLNATLAESLEADPSLTLDAALALYTVEPIREVDSLLRALRERGADRASDVLLEGQFSAFFGMPTDEATYAGKMASDLRALAREDLVVRRTNPGDKASNRLIASIPDQDAEKLGDVDSYTSIDNPVSGGMSGMPDFFSTPDGQPER